MARIDDIDVKKFGWPEFYDGIVVEKVMKRMQKVKKPEQITKIFRTKWRWVLRPEDKIFHAISFIFDMTVDLPAFRINQVLNYYISEIEDLSDFDIEKVKRAEYKGRKILNAALNVLIDCGILQKHLLKPQDGRFNAAIYVALFAEDKHIKAATDNYLKTGGGKSATSEKNWASKMANRKKLVAEATDEAKPPEPVASCEKCGNEYTEKFAGERCMNCDDNFGRVSILQIK